MNHKLFTTSNAKEETDDMGELLAKSPNTLPCLIIKQMHNHNSPLPLNQILENVSMQYDTLRKPDGAKYGNNIKRVVSSALNSTGLFVKKEDNSYYLNTENVLQYLKRNNSESKKEENFLRKKRVIKKSLGSNTKGKYIHCYQILDEILEKYSKDSSINKLLTNPFIKCSSSVELLIKIGNSDKLIGMVSCFKIFKPLLKKMFLSKKKTTKQNYKDMDEKMKKLNQGIEFIHQMLDLNNH